MDAPTILLTKLHPPSVPAEAVARERLFAAPGWEDVADTALEWALAHAGASARA